MIVRGDQRGVSQFGNVPDVLARTQLVARSEPASHAADAILRGRMQTACPSCEAVFESPWSRLERLKGRVEETQCPSCEAWLYVTRTGRVVDNTEDGRPMREFLAEFEEFQRDKELGLIPPTDYSRLMTDPGSEDDTFRGLRALLRRLRG
jgi:hypothetical protein